MCLTLKIGKFHLTAPYLLADLIELLLLVRFNDNNLINKQNVFSILENGSLSEDDHDDILNSNQGDADDVLDNDKIPNSKQEIALDNCWNIFEYREKAIGGSYPFYVDGNNLCVHEDLSDAQRVYGFLLSCSRLRSFSQSTRYEWAGYFADLSKVVMQNLLPAHGEVTVYDANSDDRKAIYGTDNRKALGVLGERLAALSVDKDTCNEQDSSGDSGIDLVGQVAFNDGACGHHVILGQCAAREKDWPSKTLEAHPIALRPFFTLLPDAMNTVFIPLSYRTASGQWVKSSKTTGCLLIDRNRALELLEISKAFTGIVATDWFNAYEDKMKDIIIEA